MTKDTQPSFLKWISVYVRRMKRNLNFAYLKCREKLKIFAFVERPLRLQYIFLCLTNTEALLYDELAQLSDLSIFYLGYIMTPFHLWRLYVMTR
jgi:hypothetical protein